METQEAQELPPKETRGRQAKGIAITLRLGASDHAALMRLTLKRMTQLGEDVPRERVISEALQALSKSLSSED